MTREQVHEVIALALALRREAGESLGGTSVHISVHGCTEEELAFAVEAGGARREMEDATEGMVWVDVQGGMHGTPAVDFFLQRPVAAEADQSAPSSEDDIPW